MNAAIKAAAMANSAAATIPTTAPADMEDLLTGGDNVGEMMGAPLSEDEVLLIYVPVEV